MDNALNKIIAFLSALCILIGLLIGSVFFLPVSFAADMSFQPLVSGDIFYNGSGRTVTLTTGSSVFVSSFYTSDSAPSVSPLYCISPIEQVVYFNRSNDSNTYTVSISYPVTGSSLFYGFSSSSNMNLYPNSSSISVPVFNSFDDMISFVNGYLPSYSSLYEGLNIPAGYAAWLELENNSSLDVVTSFEFNNAFLGDFNDTSQWSNIDLSATPDFSEVNRVPDDSWLLNFSPYGDKNIFGLTKNGIAHVPTVSGYNLWIVNPLTSVKYNLLNSEVLYNNSLTLVNTVGIKKVRLFAIDASVNSTGGITNTVLTQGGITVESTTEGGFVYTDSDNNIVSAPSNGGANTYPDSSSNIFSTIERAFNDLISRLERIFNAPAIYFERIVNALSNFGSWLGQLWSWLPAPLSALIEAVIYISILVGLIKLLLR